MVNVKKAVIGLFVVLAAGYVVFRFWPGDESAIRKQLALIEEKGSKEVSEKPIEGLLRSKQLAGLFHDPCALTVDSFDYNGEYSRKQIMDRITTVRSSHNQLRVKLYDVSIDCPQEQTATVLFTLRLNGTYRGNGIADVQEVEATLRKIEGDWLFTSVRIVEVLEK